MRLGEEFLNNLKKYIPAERIIENEDMDVHTTLRTGGAARLFITVLTKEELSNLISFLNRSARRYFILGNGSNLLVSDKGYDGIVIKLSGSFDTAVADGDRLYCGAACLLSRAAAYACIHGLTGMEFASGIPGSVGGAVVMNAGAYDGELSQIVESVEVCDREGNELILTAENMEFKYRSSAIKGQELIVTGVTFKLSPGDEEEIRAKMRSLNEQRRAKQPLEYPSAGSVFKRPEGNFTGKLIMDSGLRGFQIGGARVSDKHCGFIINLGYALSSDVYDVMCEVREQVKAKFGVTLEPEIILLGEF